MCDRDGALSTLRSGKISIDGLEPESQVASWSRWNRDRERGGEEEPVPVIDADRGDEGILF